MSYDCIIIGGGLSGLTCGIKCASAGLRTAIISFGMNALHFSSGSIDLMGVSPSGEKITEPFEYLKDLKQSNPAHPYSKIGPEIIEEALAFFRDQTQKAGLDFYRNKSKNHFRVTGLGVLKPTFLSQKSVYNEKFKNAILAKEKIAILNFDGYRDYFEQITAGRLAKNPLFKGIEIVTGRIALPYYTGTEKNLHEFRSVDLARVFDSEKFLPRIAEEIIKNSGGAKIISLPAFIGINNFSRIHQKLEEMTGCLIYEIPTLPPSILGLRVDNALKARFTSFSGEYSAGDKVNGGNIKSGMLEYITTENYENTHHRAGCYVLSTGSFFSGGLKSGFNVIEEPVFNLKLSCSQTRSDWYSQRFFDEKSHPFLSYGVETNETLNPFGSDGKSIDNLFCTGAMLCGYNPVKEASGGGVAIVTGYFAAKQIIEKLKKA